MKVALLGTSAAEGLPGLFCRCSVCEKARAIGGKNIRTRCSALVDDTLKIDFPPDILHQVMRFNIDLRCLTGLVFTHAHDDHCAAAELQYRGHYFVPEPFKELLAVYGSVDVVDKIKNTLVPGGGDLDTLKFPVDLQIMFEGKTIPVGRYRVTPIEAQHDPDQECYNLIIQDAEGVTILYATDTGWYTEDTWAVLKRFRLDGVVVECGKGLDEEGYKGHLSIPEVIRFRERLIEDGVLSPASLVVTTHFSHSAGLMHEELEALLNPHGIQVGYDGMTFELLPAA